MATLALRRVLLLLPLVAGCSISASSESSSKIISSPVTSSSKSSSASSSETAYRQDVRDHTAAFVRTSDDAAVFRAQIADVARQHGITDWEASALTWEGVGEGLAHANVPSMDVDTWIARLTGGDPTRTATARAAYDRAHH